VGVRGCKWMEVCVGGGGIDVGVDVGVRGCKWMEVGGV